MCSQHGYRTVDYLKCMHRGDRHKDLVTQMYKTYRRTPKMLLSVQIVNMDNTKQISLQTIKGCVMFQIFQLFFQLKEAGESFKMDLHYSFQKFNQVEISKGMWVIIIQHGIKMMSNKNGFHKEENRFLDLLWTEQVIWGICVLNIYRAFCLRTIQIQHNLNLNLISDFNQMFSTVIHLLFMKKVKATTQEFQINST